ncbi:hypothetical protein acdb102_33550 [Acidothermaceae bacterium B102]|nr:hypothetical protein acdb102_33550 [Acidothermaceae bacterium B102]
MSRDKIAYWLGMAAFVAASGLMHPLGQQLSPRWAFTVSTLMALPLAALVYVVLRFLPLRRHRSAVER